MYKFLVCINFSETLYFDLSTRTLRYYEQIKLPPGVKRDDYAYRTYDEAAILRLQQIMILRKLRIPLKQISYILKNDDAVLKIVDTLAVTKINFKEEKTMEELNKASESLNKLMDVRIIYLPPLTKKYFEGAGCISMVG